MLAKKRYRLTDEDFITLRCEEGVDMYNHDGPPTHMYLESEVKAFAAELARFTDSTFIDIFYAEAAVLTELKLHSVRPGVRTDNTHLSEANGGVQDVRYAI